MISHNLSAGLGLAHTTSPVASRLITSATDAHIARRWQYYVPAATIRARRDFAFNFDGSMLHRSRLHREAVLSCLRAGLPWRTITRQDLDTPFVSAEERARMIREAIERRDSRMGRVKGRVKSRRQG